MDKKCLRCGSEMQLQSDGTYKCHACDYESSSQYSLNDDTEPLKGGGTQLTA